ncbi:MAG: outer membrane beta-barrel protein [Ignavibacteriae bacterium]|nr:outer membrane beta-barrel protein [Ignavibacteriota bacterium]
MRFSNQWKTIITFVVMVFCFQPAESQTSRYALSVNGSITTSSRLFYHPFDPDEVTRNQSLPLNGVWGVGIDIRRELGWNIQVGVNIELLWNEVEVEIPGNQKKILTTDGYRALPVELSGYFSIPFSTEKFRMYMGGGVGMYFGERKYSYAGVESKITERTPGIGIHVLSGFEFALTSGIAIRTELKFRDVQFESTNVFPLDATFPPSTPLPEQTPFPSKISIDGIQFGAGLVYQF